MNAILILNRKKIQKSISATQKVFMALLDGEIYQSDLLSSLDYTCSRESFSLNLLLTRTFFRRHSFLHSSSNSTIDLLHSSVPWNTCSLDFSNSASKTLNSAENQLFFFSIMSSAIFVGSSDYSRFVFKLL